jgi:murein DD-endopeptidase MepM/ murein hydrolase activator NlpD
MLKYTLCYALFFSHLGSAQILNCDTIWMLPMTSPVELSAGFGDLRPNHFHMGIDIRTAGQVNLPIFAIGDGYVSRIKVSSVGYGWVLYIDHPNGYTSVYAHCNRFAERIQKVYLDTSCMLQNNEIDILLPPNKIQVQKGEQIAFSGNTGGSSGPHLHFELRDTKTEHALNPLLHGFRVSDSGQPILSGIRIYALDLNGYEVPTKSILVLPQQKNSKTILPPGFLREGEQIGMAIHVDDYFSKGGRVLGLFSAEVWTEKEGHFAFELDEISFDAARYINAHHDFAYAQLTKKKFQKIFRAPSNPLGIYPYAGTGSFQLGDADSTHFSIMLRDVNGNETQHELWVVYPHPKMPAKNAYNAQSHWLPNEAYTYESGLWNLQIDSFTFFEPVKKSMDLAAKRIASGQVQIARPVHISYQFKDSAAAARYIITMNGSPLSTSRAAGKVSADTKTLGTFGLRKDEIAPTVQNQANNKLDSLNNGAWTWILKDDFSGVASYACWQNGKWIPAYFDAKNQQLRAQFEVPFLPVTLIELKLRDAAGNERVVQSSTPLAPFK